jgi:hypothetical protein
VFSDKYYFSEIAMRNLLTKGILEDYVIARNLSSFLTIEDLQEDAKTYVDSVVQGSAIHMDAIKRDLGQALVSITNSNLTQSVGALTEALNKFRVTAEKAESRKKLVTLVELTPTDRRLYLTVPDLENATEDVKEHLALYIHFISAMLVVNQDKVSLCVDKTLGNMCSMSVKTRNALQDLLAAARSPTGNTGSGLLKLGGIQCPLGGVLALLRTLTIHKPFVTKLSKKAVTVEMIRLAIDQAVGLQPETAWYVKDYLRQTFNLMASLKKSPFPAAFYKVAKDLTGVKSQEGLLYKLGYQPLLPSVSKIVAVTTHTSSGGQVKDSPVKLEMPPKECTLPHDKEYQAAVKILLPLCQVGSTKVLKQLKSSWTDVSDKNLEFYKEHKAEVKEYNTPYAYLASMISKKKSKKTKPVHFRNEIGKVTRDVNSKITSYTTREGQTFSSYMELPIAYRRSFEQLLKRKASPAKRKVDEQSDVIMEASDTSGHPKVSDFIPDLLQAKPKPKGKGKAKIQRTI